MSYVRTILLEANSVVKMVCILPQISGVWLKYMEFNGAIAKEQDNKFDIILLLHRI